MKDNFFDSKAIEYSEICQNKDWWKKLTDSEKERYVNKTFGYYRKYGFPYFPTSKEFRKREFIKLMQFSDKKLIQGKKIQQTMHGLSLAWSYMPHSWDVVCNNKKTPLDVFNDDVEFKKVIKKRMTMGDNISDNGIRKMLKLYTGVQSVSNFRPTAASALYSHFCNSGDTVLDPSCGFGGRLLGAIKAGVNYIGYDPCVSTFEGLQEIKKDFGDTISVKLVNKGSEFIQESNVDFCFTSPPYFDTEKYSNEDTQSYLKFPTYNDWLIGFIQETYKKVFKALKENKYCAVNIANTKKYPNLVNDVKREICSTGFEYWDSYSLLLSNPTMNNKQTAYKEEPILIFKKLSKGT